MARGGNVLFDNEGAIPVPKITTPTAEGSVAKFYSKSDNRFYFQDGAGVEHEIVEVDVEHGEFFVKGNATLTTITDANKGVAMELGAGDHLKDFTFVAGANGVITDTANNGGLLRITDVAHGRVTGDILSINGLATASQNGITVITRIDDDTFDCQNITFATIDETGTWQMGAYLLTPAGGAGDYRIQFTSTVLSASANKTYTIQAMIGTAADDGLFAEVRLASSDVSGMGFGGIHTLAVADRIWICVNGLTDGTNLTLKHFNLSINRI
ncbi:MAG TPA: hypothetical protein ENI05_10665 [Porticoccus sp.]|nr:hypothetical protein [Porticoccus sp.]